MNSNGSPRKTDQITSIYTCLVKKFYAKVTCYSMFTILSVISSGFWQQAVYHPLAEIDTLTSTYKWADLNSVSYTDCLFSTSHY